MIFFSFCRKEIRQNMNHDSNYFCSWTIKAKSLNSLMPFVVIVIRIMFLM